MNYSRKLLQDVLHGCLPIALGFLLGALVCLLISLGSCRTQKNITTEVIKHYHDTTAVHDTTMVEHLITNNIIRHDSINSRQDIFASLITAIFDTIGNLRAVTNYTYNVNNTSQQGSTLAQVTSDSTGLVASHQEIAATGNDSLDYAHEVTKPMRSTAEKLFFAAGALALIAWLLFFAQKIRK